MKRAGAAVAGGVLAALWCVASGADSHAAADKKAYAEAVKTPETQGRIDALRRFEAEYPKSSRIGRANNLILETLVKNFPERTEAIGQQADAMLKLAKGEFRMFDYDTVASTLADGNVLLARAERISHESLNMLDRKAYVAQAKKEYAAAKMKPPSEADLDRQYKKMHSALESTLGRIYVKESKSTEGEPLLSNAYLEDSDNSVAAAGLGMLAAKAGRSEQALAYLTRARLTGKLEPAEEQQLEELYVAQHGGSDAGLEEYLDQQYAALFPEPFKVQRYDAGSGAGGRTVLAELFTGSGCDPCVGADLAIEADLERYSRKQVAVLTFGEHVPEPDPLTNPDGVKRFGFYEGQGTPTLAIDGVTKVAGADRAGAKAKFEEINGVLEKALGAPPEARIELTALRNGYVVEADTSVSGIKSDAKDLRLQIALVEDRLRYSGENGIRLHRMVVRSMAGDGDGFAVEAGKNAAVKYTFDVSKISKGLRCYLETYEKSNERFGPVTFIQKMDKISLGNLSVAAFVQDTKTRHVLQAAYAPVSERQ